MNFPLLAVTLAAILAAPPAPDDTPRARTLENSVGVLNDFAALPLKGLPPKLLADAEAVVIAPRVTKVGFLVGVRAGRGVALTRNKGGEWDEPVFVQFGGASVGPQAGLESTDVVLVFRSRKSLDRVLVGKGKLTLGADASVAAGPLGREALAATDARMEAEVLSYSRSRGLFAGVSLDGAVIRPDPETNAAFRKGARPEERKWADKLKATLSDLRASGTAPAAPPALGPTVPTVPPPALPLPRRPRPFRNR
jgi:lipid-binding SYLF domain-containing protein